jgi:hypothetical protein
MIALIMHTSIKMETPSSSYCIANASSSSTKMEAPSSYSRVGGWNRSGWDILSNGGESVKMRPYAFNIMYGAKNVWSSIAFTSIHYGKESSIGLHFVFLENV